MPYKHPIPDAPIAPSMLPRVAAADLTSQDVLILTQPGNNPGQKTKSVTLSQIADFLQLGNFSEITLNGSNGKELVLNGNGITYTTPPTPGNLDQYEITANDNGVQIAIHGNQGSRLVKVAPDEISISRILNGLESKVVLSKNGISVSSQTREGSEVVTRASTFNSEEIDVKRINGTNTGSTGNYLALGNTTVNGDLDVKDNAYIGNGLFKVDKDSQAVKIDASSFVLNGIFSQVTTGMDISSTSGEEGQIIILSNNQGSDAPVKLSDSTISGEVIVPAFGCKLVIYHNSVWRVLN